METETSSAGTLETFVILSATPTGDSKRVMANESARTTDGIDELSFRWRWLVGVRSTEAGGRRGNRGRSSTSVVLITA
jgi:hypothetical protein